MKELKCILTLVVGGIAGASTYAGMVDHSYILAVLLAMAVGFGTFAISLYQIATYAD